MPPPIETPINGPGSSPWDVQFPGPPGEATPPDGPACAAPKPPPPLACAPGTGPALAVFMALGAHETAYFIVDVSLGLEGPAGWVTAIAFDLAVGAPADLVHDYACGEMQQ